MRHRYWCSDTQMLRHLLLLVTLSILPGCVSTLVLEQDDALAVIPHQVGDAGARSMRGRPGDGGLCAVQGAGPLGNGATVVESVAFDLVTVDRRCAHGLDREHAGTEQHLQADVQLGRCDFHYLRRPGHRPDSLMALMFTS